MVMNGFVQRSITVLLLLASCFLLLPDTLQPKAWGEVRRSRLSQLIQEKPTLYLPSRLLIGVDNRIVVRAAAGSQVRLYLSPGNSGFRSPDGQVLQVSEEHQALEGTIPENGVLQLQVPVPNEDDLIGRDVYIDAITWQNPDYSDLKRMEWVDATGRRATDNKISIAKAVDPKRGANVIPSLPGLPSNALQQLGTVVDAETSGDARKKELVDPNGARDSRFFLDQNSFIQRPGALGPGLK